MRLGSSSWWSLGLVEMWEIFEEKNFVNKWKIRFREENFCRLLTCAAKGHQTKNLIEKTFVNSYKILKSANVFSLKSFLLYGILHSGSWLNSLLYRGFSLQLSRQNLEWKVWTWSQFCTLNILALFPGLLCLQLWSLSTVCKKGARSTQKQSKTRTGKGLGTRL